MRSENFTLFHFVLRKRFIMSEHIPLKINIKLTRLLLVHSTLEILYDDHLARISHQPFSALFCGNNGSCTGRKI
jgi:hypothetical protein